MAYTTINKPSEYFNTKLYTGTGSTMSITGVGFQPDWVWYKSRSTAYNHGLFDAVRGTSNFLKSNSTDAEAVVSGVTAFNSDGFSLGSDAGGVGSGNTFVAWNWLAGGTGVSNTQGSITSTVSANTTSGFSVVGYTGNGSSAQTVGHGLGATPKIIFIKRRNSASDWQVGNSNDFTKQLHLNDTTAYTANAGIFSAPNSTTFTIGNNSTVNGSSDTFIAYCFADVKGYSKVSSYTGNGSTDGTFVYTGFKPAWVMVKPSSTTGQWAICDNKRGAANILNNNGEFLFAEDSGATNYASANWDFLSNGLKARANYAAQNTSGVTYIYMAFAENPLVGTNNVPATAR